MKMIGAFEFPESGNNAEFKHWKPTIRMFPLHETVLCVAQTRVEGTWKAYCRAVLGHNHDVEATVVLLLGNQMPENTARTLFPEFKGVPYAR